MRLTEQEVEAAFADAARECAPGEPLTFQRVAELLNDRLAANLVGVAQTPHLASSQIGTCRICGCTDEQGCVIEREDGYPSLTCAWTDPEHTLCNNPECIAVANRRKAA